MRMFEILDKMNLKDVENNTRTVSISNALVEMKKTKQGAHITMGCDYQSMLDLMENKARAILCIIDYETYKQEEEGK